MVNIGFRIDCTRITLAAIDETLMKSFDMYYFEPINSDSWVAYRLLKEGLDPDGIVYGWYSETCRTITFTSKQEVSEEFYTWFIANATKQS